MRYSDRVSVPDAKKMLQRYKLVVAKVPQTKNSLDPARSMLGKRIQRGDAPASNTATAPTKKGKTIVTIAGKRYEGATITRTDPGGV